MRFLHLHEVTPMRLGAAVPLVGGWRFASVAPVMTPGDVQRLLDHTPCQDVTGVRDYAILLLVARLGLRSIEVALSCCWTTWTGDAARSSCAARLASFASCDRECPPLLTAHGGSGPHQVFARSDRGSGLMVVGSDEEVGDGQGQRDAATPQPGAVRSGEHRSRREEAAVGIHEQLRSLVANKTSQGGCQDRLPLPTDAGKALVAYLAGARPGWLRVVCSSPARLRAARSRHGARLTAIGQVLRHQDLATTAPLRRST
jgi:hypothetical protein